MLNYIWLVLVLLSLICGGLNNHLKEVTEGAFNGAKDAVMGTALPLIGTLALWLGIMRLAERSGLVQILARAVRPVMRRLFPDVPPDHPAMGAMVMNISANMLGLGNAATPLGLRAMNGLEKLNPHPGTATNSMCTFLAICTSSIQLIPASAIGLLASRGSTNPAAIVGSALFATTCAALAGVTAAKLFEKLPIFAAPAPTPAPDKPPTEPDPAAAPAAEVSSLEQADGHPLRPWGMAILAAFAVFCALISVRVFLNPPAGVSEAIRGNGFLNAINTVSLLAVPAILAFFPLYAALRGIKVYEEFVEGAKEGFQVALRIIPFLVAILAAVGMFRGSGGLDALTEALRGPLAAVGFPADLLTMTLIRPVSGGATLALFTDIVKQFGPDSLISRMAGTIYGSTETTFYVVAVYFGSVSVRRTRHAIAAGLTADAVGVIASVIICRLLFR